MAKDPAFPLYTSDFLTGIIFMSNEDIGIYIKLLCYQHQHGGLIDKDDFRSMTEGKPKVIKKFIESEDGFYNKRLMTEMVKRLKKSSSLSQNALKRWKCNANAMQMDMPTEIETESEDIVKKKKQPIKTYDFESIWSKYPNKLGKKEALGYFNAAVKTDYDFANINKAVDNYAQYVIVNKTPKKYIKTGGNWFAEWEDWVDYVVETPEPEPEKFKFHEVKDAVEKQLCDIATDEMIEKCMRNLPSNAWYLVKAYLRRKYPDGGEKAYYRIEDKLSKEGK